MPQNCFGNLIGRSGRFREPSPGLAVAFEFGFARLECVLCDIGQQVEIAFTLPALALARFDRISPGPHNRAPLRCFLARFLQSNVCNRSDAHFAATAMHDNPEHPLARVHSPPPSAYLPAGACLTCTALSLLSSRATLSPPLTAAILSDTR